MTRLETSLELQDLLNTDAGFVAATITRKKVSEGRWAVWSVGIPLIRNAAGEVYMFE